MKKWRKHWNREGTDFLKTWRLENKISQLSLANMIGYSVSLVKMWEKGSIIPKPILRYALIGIWYEQKFGEYKLKKEKDNGTQD